MTPPNPKAIAEIRSLKEQMAHDVALIAQLPRSTRAMLDLELRHVFSSPGYSFEALGRDLSIAGEQP